MLSPVHVTPWVCRLPVLRRRRGPAHPGVTAFVGRNGHGKTNLVEAIHYIVDPRSHRVAERRPLVRAGADQAIVRTAIVQRRTPAPLELEINPGKANRARVNRSPVPRPREVLGLLRTVRVRARGSRAGEGRPAERRRFLDELLILGRRGWPAYGQDYDRVLKQRNSLLRCPASPARLVGRCRQVRTLDVWDYHLARAGS